VSLFAYIADGLNGLQIVQLTSPEDTPGHYGFSPRPTPHLIAHAHTIGEALAVSEGLDRDRAIDESGNQLAVFGRRGARPFNFDEMMRLFMNKGVLWTVPEINDRDLKNNKDIRAKYGAPRGAPSDSKADKAMLNKSSLWPYGLPLIGLLAFLRKRKR
jgi:hypothetical protein